MEIKDLCSTFQERVASELRAAGDDASREGVLVEALYELSRTVLPALGHPKKTVEYHDRQAAVAELVSFIAIPLVRSGKGSRGVAVLSEVAEGCLDPLLRKKMSVYAQELLARLEVVQAPAPRGGRRRIALATAASVFAFGCLCLLWLSIDFDGRSVLRSAKILPAASQAPPTDMAASPVLPTVLETPARFEPTAGTSDDSSAGANRQVVDAKGSGTQPEQVTRIRIVNNQVLVPVTLKNAGETVKAEVVLDTGATRTAIHDNLVGRLKIDLRTAKVSQAELADGRVIPSRVVRLESVAAGPFAMTGTEVELIPYRGGDGLHDGLLGMDFLARHRYQIDVEHEVIRWF